MWTETMKPRNCSRISPYRPLRVQVSTDTVCFNGMTKNISYAGSCIGLQTIEDLPIYIDNRILVRCQLGDINESWGDEVLIGKVRWIRKNEGEVFLGVEFLDTGEYYHPQVFSLRNREYK